MPEVKSLQITFHEAGRPMATPCRPAASGWES